MPLYQPYPGALPPSFVIAPVMIPQLLAPPVQQFAYKPAAPAMYVQQPQHQLYGGQAMVHQPVIAPSTGFADVVEEEDVDVDDLLALCGLAA